MMGYNAEDIAAGIDEECITPTCRGVLLRCALNFPAMVPFWFMPYATPAAIHTLSNPPKVCPVSQNVLFDILDEVDLPPGVVNLVNGSKETVDHRC
jgi:malonate-semialdehyde dehydrogenase (acetylating)/methylmalonate-semialdehyde dehydrogenase